MLTWFPMLQKSLQTLPDDATVAAANELMLHAKDSMQDEKNGNPLKSLGDAYHMLACDDLDIPLQAAIQAQDTLMKKLGQNIHVKESAYDVLLESLRSALDYTLGN